MKSVALTPVLLVCFLAACGKPETAASASQPEGKPDAPVAGHTPKPKAARNVPLEQYVEVSNGIYSLGVAGGGGAQETCTGLNAAFRPGQSIHRQRMASVPEGSWHRLQHEPTRQLS